LRVCGEKLLRKYRVNLIGKDGNRNEIK